MFRLFHKIYAALFGYFWLPCPRCGDMYGGHEEFGGSNIYDVPDHNIAHREKLTCKKCVGTVYYNYHRKRIVDVATHTNRAME